MSQPNRLAGDGVTVLQSYNNEMVKCIEDLCSRRDELKRQIESDQEEKAKIHNDIKLLTNRLATLDEGIAQKMSSQIEFDKVINESQVAYTRMMNSSQVLLQSLQGAASHLRSSENLLPSNQDSLSRGNYRNVQKKVQIKGIK